MSYLTKLRLNGIDHEIRDKQAYERLNKWFGVNDVVGGDGEIFTYISDQLAELKKNSFQVVDVLPSPNDAKDGVIYLKHEPGIKSGTYIEYIKVLRVNSDGDEEYIIEQIGSTDIDLDDYQSRNEITDVIRTILIANGYEKVEFTENGDEIFSKEYTNELGQIVSYSDTDFTYITLVWNDNLSGIGTDDNSSMNGTFDGTIRIGKDIRNPLDQVYRREKIVYQNEIKSLQNDIRLIKEDIVEFKEKEQKDVDDIEERITQEVTTLNKQTSMTSYITVEIDGMDAKQNTVGTIIVKDVQVLRPRESDIIVSTTDWYKDSINEFNITEPGQLLGLAELVNSGKTFEGKTLNLDSNIDLAGQKFIPIGKPTKLTGTTIYNSNFGDNVFKGDFDGNGFTIKNINITQQAGDGSLNQGVGFFGIVAPGATIKNVTFENVYINTTSRMVGTVVGYIPYNNTTEKVTTIQDVRVCGDIKVNGQFGVGAILGRCETSKNKLIMKNCQVIGNSSVTSSVSSTLVGPNFTGVGGLVGAVYGTTDNIITNCIVKNITVSSAGEGVGALTGHFERGTITNNEVTNVNVVNKIEKPFESDMMAETLATGVFAGTFDSSIRTINDQIVQHVNVNNNKINNVEIHIPSEFSNIGNAKGITLNSEGYPDWEAWPVLGVLRRVESMSTTQYINNSSPSWLEYKKNIKLYKD